MKIRFFEWEGHKIKFHLSTWHRLTSLTKNFLQGRQCHRHTKPDALCSVFDGIQLRNVSRSYQDWIILIFKFHLNTCEYEIVLIFRNTRPHNEGEKKKYHAIWKTGTQDIGKGWKNRRRHRPGIIDTTPFFKFQPYHVWFLSRSFTCLN